MTITLAAAAHAGEWAMSVSLPNPRWFHLAGVGADGRLYAYAGYVRAGGQREYGIGQYAIDVLDPAKGTATRGPGITSARVESLDRLVKGRLDGSGKVHDEVIYDERVVTERLRHEVPSGRADPLQRPLWPLIGVWLPYEPDRGAWADLAIGPKLMRPDAPDPADRIWRGPAWYRYTPTLATSSDGLVYVTGGAGRPLKEPNAPAQLLGATEVWNAHTREWRELAPMRQARMFHAAAVDRKGRLFVFGGSATTGMSSCGPDESRAVCDARSRERQRESNRSLASVERYDPETNTWSERAPLPTPRQAMGADLGADGRIYVVGGAPSYAHPRPMAVVEIYDPETDTWETGPSMHYARRGHAVVATPEGKLYAIGGVVGRRQRTLREQLAGDFVDPALGATVEVLDTRPGQ